MASTAAGAFFISGVAELSLKQQPFQQTPPLPPPPLSHQLLLIRPLLSTSIGGCRRRPSSTVVSCLLPGVDGGGVSDDFVSTRKLDRGFSVIANMLKRIEPLDNSVISKGVSDSAKDSMKQTISTMLGLLPSDQFSVTVRVSKRPLDRLLVSSIITGYTLWNAEYRISLMRNLDISPDSLRRLNFSDKIEASEDKEEEEKDGSDSEVAVNEGIKVSEGVKLQSLGDFSPDALNYIQQLESELSSLEQELDAQERENQQMECITKSNNDLLEYLRSLDSDMVTELSRPSSLEVEEIIHQLVENILRRFFKDENASDLLGDSAMGLTENYQNHDVEFCICTSRDYLAKLLFWCMLLGHHLRGLENRLHLSCVVGLL